MLYDTVGIFLLSTKIVQKGTIYRTLHKVRYYNIELKNT